MVKGFVSSVTAADVERLQKSSLYTPSYMQRIKELMQYALDSGELTGAWEQIVKESMKQGTAWIAQTHSDFVGVSPSNRSSFGVGAAESQLLGDRILSVGWSWSKCADSTMFNAPPHDYDGYKTAVQYNADLVKLADGLMPPLKALHGFSVGGGHTNTFLRQVNHEVRSIVERFQDKPSSNCKKAKMVVGRPEFDVALNAGLKWVTFDWQMPFVFFVVSVIWRSRRSTQSSPVCKASWKSC